MRPIINGTAALAALCYEATKGDDGQALNRKILRIQQAISDANFQLHYGPSVRESCELSWEAACNVLREFWRDNGQDLWVHEDDPHDVCTSEPQHDHCCDDECRSDGCWYNYDDCYRCVDASEVGRILFGSDLFPYVR